MNTKEPQDGLDVSEESFRLKSVEAENEELRLKVFKKADSIVKAVSGITHDFNNLLTIISGNAQIGLDKYRGDKFADGVFEDISDAAERALDLVAQLHSLCGEKLEDLVPDNSNENDITGEDNISNSGGETILIIDDDKHVLRIIERALSSAGYRIIAAVGGENGVALFELHVEEIALVVLDLMMPELDGREVFYKIRKIRPDTKVVLCSGFSSDGMAEEVMAGGAKAFIQKPFKMAHICEVVKHVLET